MIIIILLTFAVYSPLFGNVFVDLDDQLLIIDNLTAHGLSWSNIATAFTSYDPELYIPLTLLSYQLEYSLFGLNPLAYHLVSLALHVASALLVFAIFQKFFTRTTALLCAALFAVHPINVEAVAWASGRKDVLSAVFFLLSVYWYLRWREHGKGYLGSVAAYTAGLLAKVSIVPLPLALLLLDLVQGRQLSKTLLKEKLPYFVVAAVFVVIALIGKPQTGYLLTWLLLSFVGIPFYLKSLVLPTNLSVLYPFTDVVSPLHPSILGGAILVACLSAGALLSLKKTRVFFFAWAWFLLLLAPALPTVIKGGGDDITTLYYASDRYVYLAGIGVLYLLGVLLDRKSSVLLRQGTAALIAMASVLSYQQVLVWRDSESLYTNVIEQGRESHVPYLSMARLAAERGNYEEALALYTQSYDIQANSKALLNIGQIYTLQGDNKRAIETYLKLTQRWPELADVQERIGRLYLEVGEVDQAVPYFIRALEINPEYTPAYFNLGIIFELKGQPAEAISAFQKVLELSPDDGQAIRKLTDYGVL